MPSLTKQLSLWTASLCLSICMSTTLNANETAARVEISNVIDKAIIPAFVQFDASTTGMQNTVSRLCATPSNSALRSSQEQFGSLVQSWGHVEFFRLGPLSAENRLERILFWPDRRGRGLKQVQNIIRTSDVTADTSDSLGQKSVAVQGMLALEFALFGTGAEETLTSETSFRCNYALAITGNLNQLSSELLGNWRDENGIRALWLEPRHDNPLFRDNKEQLGALIKMIRDGLEIIVAQRLDPFLRENSASAKPKSALFWRSSNTVPSLQSNIEGLQTLVEASKFETVVGADEKRVIGGLAFEFENALRALRKSNLPTAQIIEDTEIYSHLTYVRIVTNSMLGIVQDRLPAIFGLSSGFSSLDGD